MCFCMDCVCLCVCVRVYASVCQTLTAIASDTKWLFSEGFAPFHVLIASLWWQGGPLLRAALSHDSCNIYMFTLTISICCFWNNQQQRPGENGCKSRSTWVSWLGGWAWLCSAWVEGSSRRGGWWIRFSFLQGLPKVFDGGLEVSEGLWGSVRACPWRDASLGWDQSLRPAREPTGSGRAH